MFPGLTLSPALAWALLAAAGALEIVWAIGMRYAEGFTRPLPSVVTLVAMAGSVLLLALSLKAIPLGTAYAVWGGIGTVGVAAFGIFLFDEPATVLRVGCISLITIGIVGLKLVD
jgi:quaternary ammonium compound-resistance protein SugE